MNLSQDQSRQGECARRQCGNPRDTHCSKAVRCIANRFWDRFISVLPISEAAQGWIHLTDDGYERRIPDHYPKVHFDFYVPGATRIRLFLTIDGLLSTWVCDWPDDGHPWDEMRASSREWTHERTYALAVNGPFLVTQNGEHLLADRAGQWTIIAVGHDGVYPETIIAPREDGTNMLMIEDRTAKQVFFLTNGRLFDRHGVALEKVATQGDSEQRLREIVQLVVAYRGRDR